MSSNAYPYDPLGTDPANKVTGEVHRLADYHNEFNCVIPLFAPFYRKDFVLVHVDSGRELFEGLDYYLGHRFMDATATNKQMIYGSIMIADTSITGEIEFRYQTLGGGYTVPRSEALDYLAKRIREPRNAIWEEVMKYPKPVPPLDAPSESLPEAIENDPVVGALDRMRQAIEDKYAESEVLYDEFLAELSQFEQKVFDWEFHIHDHNHSNPHNDTYQNVGALGLHQDASNALKAYGKSLTELTEFIHSITVQQEQLDELMPLIGGSVLGKIKLGGNGAKIVGKDGISFVDLYTRSVTHAAAGDLKVYVDTAENKPGAAAILEAGMNHLYAHSGGSQQTDDLYYNGYVVLHTGNVDQHVPVIPDKELMVHHEDTDRIRVTGMGRGNNNPSPLRAYATFPIATALDNGLILLTHTALGHSEELAASSKLIKDTAADLDGKVDKTTKVNGKPLTGNIVLTKADLGLDRVENTADLDKPAHTAFQTALQDKAQWPHSHDIGDITGIPYATESKKGLFQLHDTIDDTRDKAITPSAMIPLNDRIVDMETELEGKLPGDVIDVTQYYGFSYLPAPVQGSYLGSGIRYDIRTAWGLIEADNTLVVLRNGADLSNRGAYYAYCQVGVDGGLTPLVSTATPYRPQGLHADYEFNSVRRGTRGAFIAYVTSDVHDNGYICVLTNNTADEKRHVHFFPTNLPSGELIAFVHNGIVYIAGVQVGNYDNGIRINMASAPISAIQNGATVAMSTMSFAITDLYGDSLPAAATMVFAENNSSTDLATKPIFHRVNGVGGITARWNNIGIEVQTKDNKARWFIRANSYESDSVGSSSKPYAINIEMDLDKRTAAPMNGDRLPIVFSGRGQYSGDLVLNSYGEAFVGAQFNTANMVAYNNNYRAVITTYNDSTPNVRGESYAGNDHWEHCDRATRHPTTLGSTRNLVGNFGSVSTVPIIGCQWLPGNKLATKAGPQIIVEYDPNGDFDGHEGFGPTTNRIDNPQLNDTRMGYSVTVDGGEWEYSSRVLYSSGGLERPVTIDENFNPSDETISVTADNYNALKADIIAQLGIPADETSALSYMSINIHPNPKAPHFAMLAVRTDRAAGGRTIRRSVVELNRLPLSGDIGRPTIKRVIDSAILTTAGSGIGNVRNDTMGTNAYINSSDNAICVTSGMGPYWTSVGGGGQTFGIQFVIDHKDDSIAQALYSSYLTYRAAGRTVTREYGAMDMWNDTSRTVLHGNKRGTTLAQWLADANLGAVVLHSSQVKSGWVIYFTEDVRFYINQVPYTIPEQGLDLQQLYPNNHKNNTFYIYASVEGGEPHYSLKLVREADNDQAVYIGYCITDDERIVDLQVERATRLGSFRELHEHEDDPNAHDILGLGKVSVGLDLVENMPMLHSLTLQSVGEMFPDWTEFCHWPTTSDQPADRDTLNKWAYTPADGHEYVTSGTEAETKDMFMGIIQSHTFDKIDFDVEIASDTTDDDWAGIVLAYVKDASGKEHTLSILRANGAVDNELHAYNEYFGGINDTRVFQSAVVKNFRQNQNVKVIGTHGEGVSGNGWTSQGKTRIRCEFDGDIITVKVYGWEVDGQLGTVVHTYNIDLSKDPDLHIFRGPKRYGFCMQSLSNAKFRVLTTHEEFYRAHYASEWLAREAATKISDKTLLMYGEAVGTATIQLPTPWHNHQSSLKALASPKGWAGTANAGITQILSYTTINTTSLSVVGRTHHSLSSSAALSAVRYVLMGKK